jgi:hypothetical protein
VPPFVLDPSLDPANYKITDSLADVKSWRAKTVFGASYQDESKNKEPGDWDTIGYIMISKTRNTIIPIPRADEHHQGYDSLSHINQQIRANIPRARRGRNAPPVEEPQYINIRDYIPIWSGGQNYIYDAKDVPDFLNVLEKYLSYGGPDGYLQGSYGMKGMVMSLSDFVANKGPYVIRKGELAPVGRMIVAAYQSLSQALRAARGSDKRSVIGKAFQIAMSVQAVLRKTTSVTKVGWQEVEELGGQIKALQKTGDVQGLEKLMFGFDSIKHKMHDQLRAYVERKAKGEHDHWQDDDHKACWGDVSMAVDLLGRF